MKTGREAGTQLHYCTRNTHYAGCEKTRSVGGTWSNGSNHTESPQCHAHQMARPAGPDGRLLWSTDNKTETKIARELAAQQTEEVKKQILETIKANHSRYYPSKAPDWFDKLVKEAKAQSGTSQLEEIFNYGSGRRGSSGKGQHGITIRKGHGSTQVTHQHNKDQDLLVGLLGGTVVVEEDFIDITDTKTDTIYEYKPKVTKQDVATAIGQLVQGRNAYIRRYGRVPGISFISRVKLHDDVKADFAVIGASVKQLKENELV